MKKLIAVTAATAMLGAAGSVFAAERLSDTQMDAVSAGGFLSDNQVNFSSIRARQNIAVNTQAWKGGEALSAVEAKQVVIVSQRNYD